jgi:hypothetical protein
MIGGRFVELLRDAIVGFRKETIATQAFIGNRYNIILLQLNICRYNNTEFSHDSCSFRLKLSTKLFFVLVDALERGRVVIVLQIVAGIRVNGRYE